MPATRLTLFLEISLAQHHHEAHNFELFNWKMFCYIAFIDSKNLRHRCKNDDR